MVAIVTSRPGLPNNMIIKDCPLQINFIQRLLSNNRDCWTHGKSLCVTIAPGITVMMNCYLRSSQKQLAKLSPGRQLAALEGFIQQVNLRKSMRCLAKRIAICIYRGKPPRMRRRRLHMSSSDPKTTSGRPQDHELTGFSRRGRHGGVVNFAN